MGSGHLGMAGKGGWPGQQTEVARKAPDSQRVVGPSLTKVVGKGLKQGPYHRVINKRGAGLRKTLVFWGKTKLSEGNRREAQLK